MGAAVTTVELYGRLLEHATGGALHMAGRFECGGRWFARLRSVVA